MVTLSDGGDLLARGPFPPRPGPATRLGLSAPARNEQTTRELHSLEFECAPSGPVREQFGVAAIETAETVHVMDLAWSLSEH